MRASEQGEFGGVSKGFRQLRNGMLGLAMLALSAPALPQPATAQDFSFQSVRIEGNKRIEPGTILSFAAIPRGEAVSAGALNDALQRVLGSGLFETVDFEPRGGTLVITVTERPTISDINIEGNRRIEDEELIPLLTSQIRRVYSPQTAEADANAILEAYTTAGRFAATVTPRIIRRPDNRVDLVFEVTEGDVVEIERISFVGNRDFSDRRLRRVIDTKQAGLFRSIIRRDTFIADRIAFDRQLLRDFYLSRGYVDFRVLDVATEFSRERDATFITFTVDEGRPFDVGAVTVTSELADVEAGAFEGELRIRSGARYTPLAVDATINRMEALALREGLDFVRVRPVISRNERESTLDIDFVLERGPRVFVERIDIEGNQTTLDRVIRRQFRVSEADPFNPREIRNAAERIRALGFFANADVNTREGSSPSQVIVDVDVEEQPTGSFSFGGSYSVDAGFGVVLSFSEINFLGRGQTLRFDVSTTSDNRQFGLTFIEPAFLGRDLTFGIRSFYTTSESENADYSIRTTGFEPFLEFQTGEISRLRLSYTLSEEEIYDVDSGSSLIIQNEDGTRVTSALGYSYSWDTRRAAIDPNRGVALTFGQEVAGLGGDNKYLRSTARAIGQTTAFNEEITLRAIFEGGAVQMLEGGSRLTDRFFLSSNQLRGFEFRGLGPRDTAASNEDPLGGNYYAVARFEADFPLGLPDEYGISGGVFLDVGSLWDLDDVNGSGGVVDDSFNLRSSVGFSLFWTTPIGPLTFNFSRILEKQPYDREQLFDFTITTRF